MDIKGVAYKAIGWIFGIGFITLTAALSVGAFNIWAVLVGLIGVALCLPPLRELIASKLKLRVSGAPLVIICFILVGIQVTLVGDTFSENSKADEAKKEQEMKDRVANARAKALAEFNEGKVAILKNVSDLVGQGKVSEARDIVFKYSAVSQDPDLANAKRLVDYEYARAELKNEANMPLHKRVELYKFLAAYDVKNTAVVAKAKALEKELADKLAAEAAAKAKAEEMAKRKQTIEAQFSGWDGSHPRVEAAIKASMKDPDSYKHVETRYVDKGGSTFLVFTTIRGTNSFGGVVPNSFVAEVSLDGRVVSLRNTE